MKVYGYVFDQPGNKYRKKFLFEGTAEKIATFIMMHRLSRVCITTRCDEFICDSLPSGFINNCADFEFLQKELMPAIRPMQTGKKLHQFSFMKLKIS